MSTGSPARAVLRRGAVVAAVALAALALLAAVPATELGTRWLAATIDWWAGERIRIGGVSGRLVRTLRLHDVEVRNRSLDLSAAEAVLSWDPGKLFGGEAHLDTLAMEGVRLTLHELPADPAEAPPAALAFTLAAPSVTITDLSIVAGDEVIPVESVKLSAHLGKSGLTVTDLDAAGRTWRLTGNGALAPARPFALSVDAQWERRIGGRVQAGRLKLSGDARALDFDVTMHAPLRVDATGRLERMPQGYEVAASGAWRDLRWPPEGPVTLSSPRGTLEVHGRPDDFRAVLEARVDSRVGAGDLLLDARGGATMQDYDLDVRWRAELADGQPFEGRGRIDGGAGRARIAHLLSVPFELRTEGVVDAPGATPELHLSGDWRDLHWPLDETARYRSASGSYTVNGPLDALEIQLDGALEAGALPPGRIALTGRLDDTGLELEPLLVHALGGRTYVRGRIGRHPDIDWKLELVARGIDPGRRWPQWNGTLDGAASLEGRWVEGIPHAAVHVRHLEGRLRGYPVEARGKLEVAGERLHAHGVSLRSGDNRLHLDGVYDREMDFEFSLDAADLGAVLPDAGGRLAGEGVVKGSLVSPRAKVRLAGQDMHYRDWGARRLEVDADVSDAQSVSQVVVRAEDARAGAHRIGSVELRADGRPTAHAAHAALASSLGDLDLRLVGGMEAGRWRGELADARVAAPTAGTWRLARAAELSVDAGRIRLEWSCLESDAGARLCADFERTDQIQSSIDVEALPLSVLQPWLPADAALTGEIDAAGAWSLRGGRLEGNVAATLSPGELTLPQGRSQALSLPHADTKLDATIDERGAEIGLDSMIAGDGRVRGRLLVQGLDEEAALDGRIEVSFPRLEPVAAFAALPFAAEGEAFMEARIGGSVAAPRATGSVRIEVAHAIVHDLGIELSDSRVEARAEDGNRVTVAGELRSGGGHLSIEGSGLLEAEDWAPEGFVVTGESFELLRLPEAIVAVSPDLSVRTVGESLEIGGRVVIPRARITPTDPARAAVEVSGDEVLVDRSEAVSHPEAGGGPDFSADLVLVLGDEVVFDGFGLLSRLAGELRVRHERGTAPATFGTLDLVDGQFMLYGQRLDIEHGRVTLAGALNDPALDIRAVRKAGDVSAGIAIGGTLSNPESRVYSEPPLAEAEALSLLLTGHNLSNADEREAAMLAQAALSLGLEGSERIGTRIRTALGLDELIIGGRGDTGDASLILGKRLSPDFGVRYVHSLAREAGSVFVDYRLTDHLSIEAQSGLRQGLDLLFRIEREDALP